MSLTIYSHPEIFLHDAAANHVAMAPDRISRIHTHLAAMPGVCLADARRATVFELLRVHGPNYLALLQSSETLTDGGTLQLNSETILNRHTWATLLRSAGAVCQAVDAAVIAPTENAFCVGYAGHHALADRGEGFCFINSVAVGAAHALSRGLERVAILDIDTHSGNGTVMSFLSEPRVQFVETYQDGFPGDFLAQPLPSNMLRARCVFTGHWTEQWKYLLARVAEFEPQIVLVSAGFDAHRADPLSLLKLEDSHYSWIGEAIAGLGAPVVATLEGGYSVDDTARCAGLFCEALKR